MRFKALAVEGAFLIEADPQIDERGHFVRLFDAEAFADRGLCTTWAQEATSFNRERGILRGFHYQAPPFEEVKVIRCTQGAIFDVILDLRLQSPTFRHWASVELRGNRFDSLYVPAGCAHGYQVMEDGSEVNYLISSAYHSDLQRGIRWDDPQLAVPWPVASPRLSERDRTFPFLRELVP